MAAAAANSATPTCERRTRIHVDSGVYYNPKHKLDRSLCVLALQAAMDPDQCPIRVHTADGAEVLDAFAGCGVRALRVSHVRCRVPRSGMKSNSWCMQYCAEVPGVKSVVAVDASTDAVANMRRNCKLNGTSNVKSFVQDANDFMSNASSHQRFTLVDLDPFGSALPYLNAALSCVSDGGILSVASFDVGDLTDSVQASKVCTTC